MFRLAEIAGELRDTHHELGIVKQDRERANGQLNEMKTHLEDLRAKLESTIRQRDEVQDRADSLTVQLRQIEILKGNISACKDEMASLSAAIKQAEVDKKILYAENARLEGLLAEQESLRAQLKELRENLESRERALKQVRDDKLMLMRDVESVKGAHQETRNELTTTAQDYRLVLKDFEASQTAEATAKATLEDLQARYAVKSQEAKSSEADRLRVTAEFASVCNLFACCLECDAHYSHSYGPS